MRKTLIPIVVLFVGFVGLVGLVAAATAAELKDQALAHLDAAESKKAALETKQYSGTFEQILAVRVADVNDVCTDIANAKLAAAEALRISGSSETVSEAMKRFVSERSKEKLQQDKQRNGDILLQVEIILNDPENAPDPGDIDELARREDLRVALLAIVEKNGGV